MDCSSQISPLPKSVVKKKFICGFCMKGATLPTQRVDPPKPVLPNRKSEGFPGFGHIETIRADQKSNDNTKFKKVVTIPKSREPTSTKSSPGGCTNDVRAAAKVDEVKVEKKSPTPEQEIPFQMFEQNELINKSPISVRTDLVQTTAPQQATNSHADEIKAENGDDQMTIQYDSKTVICPHESIPDVRKWDIDEVYTYFLAKDTPEFAQILRDHQIDGDALLLIKREDVLDRFNLKLGAALRLYAHIVSLQYKNNNPILAWNEF